MPCFSPQVSSAGSPRFAAFSLDAVLLRERGQTITAVLYVAVSVVAAIVGVFAGVLPKNSL
jgi:fluoride exporter